MVLIPAMLVLMFLSWAIGAIFQKLSETPESKDAWIKGCEARWAREANEHAAKQTKRPGNPRGGQQPPPPPSPYGEFNGFFPERQLPQPPRRNVPTDTQEIPVVEPDIWADSRAPYYQPKDPL